MSNNQTTIDEFDNIENPILPENVGFNGIIRTMVRGVYSFQLLRVQIGNRLVANFKDKLGFKADGMTEKELAAQEKRVLDKLRESYIRLTDGVVHGEAIVDAILPAPRKFKGDGIISTYAELGLIRNYMEVLKSEESQFKLLENCLIGIPIYDKFLWNVQGIGPAMAGVIISEINIHRAEYPSSLQKYAGLDVVTIGVYTDAAGKEITIPGYEVEIEEDGEGEPSYWACDGKYKVQLRTVGRSRKEYCLEDRLYTDKDGKEATRRSITYNPFLKTKLVGVLASSFLRSSVTLVDGEKMGAAKRVELAKKLGYTGAAKSDLVLEYLKANKYEIRTERNKYAQEYYNYRERLDNSGAHDLKSDGHKHNMAMRYMIKRFLVDLYVEWRTLEGLVVAEEYSVAKLGLVHGKATAAKARKTA
jgi:hypothetical protein